MKRSCLIVCGLLPLVAAAQFQVALDTTSTQNNIIFTATVATNGDRLLALRGSSGFVLWRSSPEGNPLWAREFSAGSPGAVPQVVADDANGALVLQLISSTYLQTGWSVEDTLRQKFLMARVDQNGGLSWSRTVTIDSRGQQFGSVLLTTTQIRAGANAIFIVAHTPEGENQFSFLKFNGQGQLEWARSYRTDQYALYQSEVRAIAPDQGGGLYFTVDDIAPMWTTVGHVLADGSLEWLKKLEYTNATVIYNPSYDAVGLADGSVQLLGRMDIPGHTYRSTVKLSAQATVEAAHFYTLTPTAGASLAAMDTTPDGRTALALDSTVVMLAANGDVAAAAAMTSHITGNQRNRFIPFRMKARPEGIVLAGVLDHVHVDLGFTYHQPGVRAVDPDAPGCNVVAVDVGHVVVPAELYQVEDLGAYHEETFGAGVADTSVQVAVRPALPTVNLCEVMIPTGISPAAPEAHRDLLGNVVQQGDPIPLVSGGALRMSVYDASGRCLLSDRYLPAGTGSVQTAGWGTGICLVRIADPDGRDQRVHRVLILP
ncbi:MAG: hypothetical protein JSS84_08585 [Bacteroidetes bacterium]|nr:hypothetical protein [Bacteroidota bacterium]